MQCTSAGGLTTNVCCKIRCAHIMLCLQLLSITVWARTTSYHIASPGSSQQSSVASTQDIERREEHTFVVLVNADRVPDCPFVHQHSCSAQVSCCEGVDTQKVDRSSNVPCGLERTAAAQIWWLQPMEQCGPAYSPSPASCLCWGCCCGEYSQCT